MNNTNTGETMTTTNTGRRELAEESRLRKEAKAAKVQALRTWIDKNPGEPVARGAEAVGMSRWQACDLAKAWGIKVAR